MSQAKQNKKRTKEQKMVAAKGGTLSMLFGKRTKIDKDKKEHDERIKQDKKQRAQAKNILDFIGYDAMYKDGIAQVQDGLYSQTVEFSDISYQSAKKEHQENVFSVMSQNLNYFPADTCVQLTIANTPIAKGEVGNKKFFEKTGADTDIYVEEYNKILNTKMKEGVSNLVRRRFFTYLVNAENVENAIPKLQRIKGDLSDTLARIKCETHALNGYERLQVLHSQLCPNKDFFFDWGKISAKSNMRTKDFVAPNLLDFKPSGRNDCFISDDNYCSVLVIRSFGSMLEDSYMAKIIDLAMPLSVNIFAQPIAQADALAMVKKQLGWIDKEIIDEQMSAIKKGYDYTILPAELKYTKEEAEELLDFLRNKNEHLFIYTGLIYTYAPTQEELDRQVEQILSVARGNSIEIAPLYYQQRQGLNSILPLGMNHVEVSRYLTTGQIAMQMPFASLELNQPGGGYYGQSKQSGNLVICNRKKLASPMGFVCGKPGSGKSFSVKREITNTVLAYPHDEIIIFDPAGEYGNLISALGGENIKLAPDSKTCLNPFDLSDVADKNNTQQLAFKIDAFLALSSAMCAESDQGLPEEDKSIITRCVETAYKQCSQDKMPILEDFYNLLIQQPEEVAREIALRYERYTNGAMSFLNNQSNVTFANRITNVDLHDLSTNMRVFGMLTALETVRNRMYTNFERGVTTWLYIDEVQSLFNHPTIIDYFAKFWAEGRKFNLICTGISQNTSYMLQHEQARTMVLNSDFCLLHKQAHQDLTVWADMLNLSRAETEYISDNIKAGEGLLVAGGAKVPIRDDFPKGKLYDLFNTKPEEIAQLKRVATFAQNKNKENVSE